MATAFERSLDLGTQAGLSEEEARLRLGQQGPNELPTQKRRNLLDIVLEVMREPMFIMLIVAGGLYLFLGDASEAVMLLGFVFVVMGITIIQSRRTGRALDALRDLSSPRALETTGLPEELHPLLENAVLASARDPFDPMERALHATGDRVLKETEHLHPGLTLVRAYPLSVGLAAVTQAWQSGQEANVIIASKGAPEAIAKLCHMTGEQREAMLLQVATLASDGLRVLGVARGTMAKGKLPDAHGDVALEFLGLLGFEDPLRPTVPAAVAECRTAGIRVVMITGDYAVTAQSIARQAGLANCEDVITGPELEAISD
ncbi:MAG TPA: cation-transporting P-type ATPase, partial [Polyangia bacterium]